MNQQDFDNALKDLHKRIDSLLQKVAVGGAGSFGADLTYEVNSIKDLSAQIDAVLGSSGNSPVQGGSSGPLPPAAPTPASQPVAPAPVTPESSIPVAGSPAAPVVTVPTGGQQPMTPAAPAPVALPVG